MLTDAQQKRIGFTFVLNALEPYSPYGEAQKRALLPYSDKTALNEELDALEALGKATAAHPTAADAVAQGLMQLRSIDGSLDRIQRKQAEALDLFLLKGYLMTLERMTPQLNALLADEALLALLPPPLTDALDILDATGERSPAFLISERWSKELSRIRSEKRALLRRVNEANTDAWEAERSALCALEEREERRVLLALQERLLVQLAAVRTSQICLGRLDFLLAKGRLARHFAAVRPHIGGMELRCTGLVRPDLMERLRETGRGFTPIDLTLPRGATVLVGANMGGKSVALETLALNVLLARCGLFVFAKSAEIPFFTELSILCEDGGSALSGLSSFGAELTQLQASLEGLTDAAYPLLLLDEPARGTNPDEGAAISAAIVRRLNKANAVSLLSTHYDGVAQYAAKRYRVAGLRREAGRGLPLEACMEYGLVELQADERVPRDALRVCRRMGLDEALIADAETLLRERDK